MPTELAHAQHAASGRLPLTVGILVPRLTVTPDELAEAYLPDAVEADISHVRNLLDDVRKVGETGEVAPGDAHHLALFELAQARQDGAEVGRGKEWLEPAAHLIAHSLLTPGKLEHFRL